MKIKGHIHLTIPQENSYLECSPEELARQLSAKELLDLRDALSDEIYGNIIKPQEPIHMCETHTQVDCPICFIPQPKPTQECEFNPQSMDAVVWAKEFMRVYNDAMAKQHHLWIEEDLMRAWFANAIMAGYDEARRRYEKPEPKPTQEHCSCKDENKTLNEYSNCGYCGKPLKKECEPKPERIELTELRKWMDEFEDRFCKIIINHLSKQD